MTELDPKDSVRKEQLGKTEDTKKETVQSDNHDELLDNKVDESQLVEPEGKNEDPGDNDDAPDMENSSENPQQAEGSNNEIASGSENNVDGKNEGPDSDEKDKTSDISPIQEGVGDEKNQVDNSPEPAIETGQSDNIGDEKVEDNQLEKPGAKDQSDHESTGEGDVSGSDTDEKVPENEKETLTGEEEKTEEINDSSKEETPAREDTPELNKSDQDGLETETEKESPDLEIEEGSLPTLKDINYTTFSKEELVDTLRRYISEYPLEKIKNHVETIKSVFYKIHNEEVETIHKNFIAEGGKEEDFKVEDSPVEINMKELLNIYRDKRNEQSKSLEEQKEINLQAKYDIIEAIKELINSQESLNKTFHDFRSLQESWREIGPVPQKNLKDLWESYHYHVEAFYDYIKINKELRDLDFKKNLDAKLQLCEKAEELLLGTSVVEAFRRLQVLHDQWREIGPVPADKRSEIWERFRDATSKINRRHQEYFVNLKEEQKKNLQEKTALCEKAEEIAELEIDNAKDWETKSKELIEIQKVWKTIGFAPKKHNTKIYERFRAACDSFFDKKREYFASNREEQENNLQLKTELCIQAESLQDSTDWKKTTDELIKLQKRWKTIGPVPVKQSDKIWKRFRASCDIFFNNKSKYYENIDSKYEDNLKAKEELIQKIEELELSSNINENLESLKTFQRDWAEIGFVPIKKKDEIQEKYREAINKKFDQLKIDDIKKSLLKFRSRIESIIAKPNSERRLAMERDKCYNKLKQLENDITLWENNIGFFSSSKNAESMITDVERKIKSAKMKIELLQEKINIIDEYD